MGEELFFQEGSFPNIHALYNCSHGYDRVSLNPSLNFFHFLTIHVYGKGELEVGMWNAETAQRLACWYASPEGTFALCREHRLFQRLVSDWPRRGHTLLDVGCGPGVFLEMFWEYGFDVTGLDTSQAGVDMARERLGHRADFRIGQPDFLPFEDESVDYVALISVLEYVADPKAVLAEALRVAARGVLLGFMNRWSFYGLMDGPPWPWTRARSRHGRWLSPWRVAGMVRELSPGARVRTRTVLCGPPRSWQENTLGGRLNTPELPLPIGAFAGLRVDMPNAVPLTPLHLRTTDGRPRREEACATCSSTV